MSEVLVAFKGILCPKWISAVMDENTKEDAQMYFFRNQFIPGEVMAVDGTLVEYPHQKITDIYTIIGKDTTAGMWC